MLLLSQNAFAKRNHITKQAVSAAVKRGTIHKTANKIDPDHPTNRYYVECLETRRAEEAETERLKAEYTNDGPPAYPPVSPKPRPVAAKKPDIGKQTITTRIPERTVYTKAEADLDKVTAQTAQIRVKLAEQMRELVAKELVHKTLGVIYSIAVNYFLPMGDRLAPILCGICSVTDPVIVNQVQDKIDKEIERALAALKEATVDKIEGK